ncbi:MAG: PspA/IM30 family protein [Cyanobacteria bacterium J06628_6]
MRILEAKLAEARTKKDMFIARSRSAQASQRLHEMIGQVEGNMGAFSQIEEKITDLEAQAAAIAEVNALSTGDSLDQKFAALENSNVENELAAMKARLSGPDHPRLPRS